MNKRTNYFKIGAFTLASIALVIIFLILLGMGHLFQHTVLAETYFDESVQGLNIGSPVKYRGVNVGKVTAIDMVNDVYGDEIQNSSSEAQRYIYVQFSLTQQLNHVDTNAENTEKMIKAYVAKGFRASLATQDLVGNAFLSLNFVNDPSDAPMLPISWKPQHIYIPSTPSTLSQLTDNIANIITNFKQIDFAKVVNDIDQLSLNLDKAITNAQVGLLSEKMNKALIETTSAMQQINALSSKVNLFTAAQQGNWANTFDTLQQMSLNLASISNTLKNNPSAVIFDQPAEPMDPSK